MESRLVILKARPYLIPALGLFVMSAISALCYFFLPEYSYFGDGPAWTIQGPDDSVPVRPVSVPKTSNLDFLLTLSMLGACYWALFITIVAVIGKIRMFITKVWFLWIHFWMSLLGFVLIIYLNPVVMIFLFGNVFRSDFYFTGTEEQMPVLLEWSLRWSFVHNPVTIAGIVLCLLATVVFFCGLIIEIGLFVRKKNVLLLLLSSGALCSCADNKTHYSGIVNKDSVTEVSASAAIDTLTSDEFKVLFRYQEKDTYNIKTDVVKFPDIHTQFWRNKILVINDSARQFHLQGAPVSISIRNDDLIRITTISELEVGIGVRVYTLDKNLNVIDEDVLTSEGGDEGIGYFAFGTFVSDSAYEVTDQTTAYDSREIENELNYCLYFRKNRTY